MTLFILPLFLGPTELILILLVVLLLFGGRKIPELMRGLGAEASCSGRIRIPSQM